MKKYMITNNVDTTRLSESDIVWAGTKSIANIAMFAAPFIPVVGIVASATAIAVKHMLRDNSIIKIDSENALKNYKNCISSEWKKEVLYIEHPNQNNVLIEASLYKDYILREMVADISNYIMDQIDLKSLVVGMVSSKGVNGKGTISVQELSGEARMNCKLAKNYVFSVGNTHAMNEGTEENVWINQFPDIIAAVKHNAGRMEVRKTVRLDLDVVGGIKNIFDAGASVSKEYEFYILFEQ